MLARAFNSLLLTLAAALPLTLAAQPSGEAPTIPRTQTTALDGHAVNLPHDLAPRATVLILGFGRHSSNATTAWEKPVRNQLARAESIGFYDMAMLAEVPGFVRPWVLRAIRHEVPDTVKPHFLPLVADEDEWKRTAGYAADQPDAAYVVLVDRDGHVVWSTHAAYSEAGFAELSRRAKGLTGAPQ